MNINQAFPSDYLKVSDLGGRAHKLLMGQLTTEKIGQDMRPVLHFQNAGKGLVLNRTNANTIANMYGEETDNWFGQPITIFPDTTDFRGERVPCIRVQMEYKPQPQPDPARKAALAADGYDTSGLQPSTVAAGGPPLPPNTELGDPGAGLDDDVPF